MLAGPRVASTKRSPCRARQASPRPTRCCETLRVFDSIRERCASPKMAMSAPVRLRSSAFQERSACEIEVPGEFVGSGGRPLRQGEQLSACFAPPVLLGDADGRATFLRLVSDDGELADLQRLVQAFPLVTRHGPLVTPPG